MYKLVPKYSYIRLRFGKRGWYQHEIVDWEVVFDWRVFRRTILYTAIGLIATWLVIFLLLWITTENVWQSFFNILEIN